MKEKVIDALQRFVKAMFIPVLILPAVGMLIALSSLLTSEWALRVLPFLGSPLIAGFFSILSGAMVFIARNLSLIFAVGISMGLAEKKKSEAGFMALLAFTVFIYAMNRLMIMEGIIFPQDTLVRSGQAIVLGFQIMDMGIFLGIIIGLVTAFLHNRFIETEFKSAFQIYGGLRLVFIILIPVTVILAMGLTFIWPMFQRGIMGLGSLIAETGNLGLFVYGMLDRLLIPTGLQHLVYTPFLYSSLGGVQEVGGVLFEGARSIYFAEMADSAVRVLSRSVIWDARGISKIFGLTGACLAMIHTAKKENRSKAKAVLVPAALVSFLSGVTEPLEFAFMFVSPLLFVIHSVLSGLSMVVLSLLDVRAIGPGGMMDFLLYNLPLGAEKTRWPLFILVGLGFFIIYYGVFRVLIKGLDLKTIGREKKGEEVRLYTKEAFPRKRIKEEPPAAPPTEEKGKIMLEALGGRENIVSIDNCYTRLRLVTADSKKVDEEKLKNETGAGGVVIKGENVQVVYGLNVAEVRKLLEAELYLSESRTDRERERNE